MASWHRPFGDDDLAHVLLERSPLVRVLVQLRFPPIASIAREEFIGPFQESLRGRYPRLTPERSIGMALSPGVTPQPTESVIWRLTDRQRQWQVSLATDFLSLDTDHYTRHEDLLERFGEILHSLETHIGPGTSVRLGVRYVDRIDNPSDLRDLRDLVRADVLGVVGGDHGGVEVLQGISESVFDLGDSRLLGRWGLLPPNGTLDPTLPGVPRPSWVLDLDMFREEERDFAPEALAEEAGLFSRRIHQFFRWSVTVEFLRRFGAAEEELQRVGLVPS